jgi:hypothetical protein
LAVRLINDENAIAPDNLSTPNNLLVEGAEWVDLFVREMMCATSMDDAKARAARLLEILEKSISSRAGVEATQILHKVHIGVCLMKFRKVFWVLKKSVV